MKPLKITIIIIITLGAVLAAAYFIFSYFKPRPGGILVDTTPVSSVYINGDFVGKTPFQNTNEAGQISLKLIPSVSDQDLISYETKINLVAGIQTVVRREFGKTEEASSGDVISFDKASGNLSGLVVVSTPDNAQVLVDDVVQGFSPYNASSITAGSHKITVRAQGYIERTMNVRAQPGFRLTVFAKLAKSQQVSASPTPSPQNISTPKSFVIIGNTPTGFLRMRTEPDTKGEEIAELKAGSKYLFLEADLASGWYKIQYQDPAPGLPNGITGWVSNQYASIATDSATVK